MTWESASVRRASPDSIDSAAARAYNEEFDKLPAGLVRDDFALAAELAWANVRANAAEHAARFSVDEDRVEWLPCQVGCESE